MIELVRDLVGYIRHRRGWWLIPVVVPLLYVSIVLLLGAVTEIAPLIYSLY